MDDRGHYEMRVPHGTLRLVLPDGPRRPLQVALLPDLVYAPAVTIDFAPEPGDGENRPRIPNLFVLD